MVPGRHLVVGTQADPALGEVRDPFVFSIGGHRYAVQGAGHRHGRPQLLLYGCDDLRSWVPLGSLLGDDDPIAAEVAPANIWECPNLARIDDRWVLLVSLCRWRDETHDLAGVSYLVGDLVPEAGGLRFVATSGATVDTGPAFYAPQLLVEDDRTLLWGWAWELDRTTEQVRTAGWAGVLTFPRELSVRDGVLRSEPAAELAGLRRGVLAAAHAVQVPAFEVLATGPVTLGLRTSTGTGPAPAVVVRTQGTPEEPARILVDGSMVETWAAGVVSTTRAYPDGSGWTIEGAAADLTVFRLAR